MREVATDLLRVGRFTPAAPYQRFAYLCSGLLIASAAFHAVVFLVDGGPWVGPISWRKPIVFGLSFGITLATLTWITTFLRPRKAVGWAVLGTYALASLGEVALISMQRWRGVPSHFNESTAFDGLVFSLMGSLVTLVGILTVLITVRSFFRVDAPRTLAWAIRLGLVLMLVSQAVGVQMIAEGGNTFGAAGALKVPHAVALHAAQVLPALALVLLASRAGERHALRVLAVGATGYVGLLASVMAQTYSGRAALDLAVVPAGLALLGFGLLVGSGAVALFNLAASRSPTSPHTLGGPTGPAPLGPGV